MSATEALAPALPRAIDVKAEAVLQRACERDLRLVTAESCTGGLLASLLTDVPGCSHAFERGFVVYTEEAKIELLGVPPELIEEEDVVSRPVALAMARGALKASKGDIALAVTGYAEAPPDDDDAIAGLVHFACVGPNGHEATKVKLYGDIGRAKVRIACLETALELIEDALDA